MLKFEKVINYFQKDINNIDIFLDIFFLLPKYLKYYIPILCEQISQFYDYNRLKLRKYQLRLKSFYENKQETRKS